MVDYSVFFALKILIGFKNDSRNFQMKFILKLIFFSFFSIVFLDDFVFLTIQQKGA